MTRVAAVDLGTNSTRLLVADVDGDRVAEVARRLAITRLGERVDSTGRLLPEAMGRVRDVLYAFREEAGALGAARALAVATSAVREAENGRAFLEEVERETGFSTLLLDGRAEAELTFRGVRSGRRELVPDTLVLDIGGGSTEVTLGGPDGISCTTSLQAGCVRLTERFLHGDPPRADELDACAAYVGSLLPPLSPRQAIGVAGTVTTAAALDLGLERYEPEPVHGHRLSRAGARRVLGRLARLPLPERRRVPALEPARAPVIVAGLVILCEVLDAYALPEIEASERDILHGAALAAAASEKGAPP